MTVGLAVVLMPFSRHTGTASQRKRASLIQLTIFSTMLHSEWKFFGFGLAMNILARKKTFLVCPKETYVSLHSHRPPLCRPLVPSTTSTLQSAGPKSNLLDYIPEKKVGSRTQVTKISKGF